MEQLMLFEPPDESAWARTITAGNEETAAWGLTLSGAEIHMLWAGRLQALRDTGRVEFGEGILKRLIEVFRDSPYLTQVEYAETLYALQELFYHFKKESMEAISDEALLLHMKTLFDGPAAGSPALLAGHMEGLEYE